MKRCRIISLLLSIVILTGILPIHISAANNDKTMRAVYLHAQGENPQSTPNNSVVYMGEDADIYFAVDDPNKGAYENNIHKEPQYDMNGYTLRICFDADYFDFAGDDNSAPIDYTIPDTKIGTTDKGDQDLGEDTGTDVPLTVGYFVYRHGSGTYTLGAKTYKTAYITVFYSGGYVPQREDNQLWYNLAKLSLTPRKTGSTTVFIDIDSGHEDYTLELFAKNQSDELLDQTFSFNAINGGYHHILIKDKSKPAPPIATPTSGSYVEKVTVELDQEDGLPIFYTKDGNEPKGNASAIPYTGPIEITLDTEIKACAYRATDDKYSSTVSYEYKILPERPYLFEEDTATQGKTLLPDINNISMKKTVYVSDDDVYRTIADGSEVYYTFSDLDLPEDKSTITTDKSKADNEWVKVTKLQPTIDVEKNCTVRLVTDKGGHISEEAIYYFSIKPLAPESNYRSGEYDQKIDVTLTTRTENAAIYYTTDGSDPKNNGKLYTGIPITLAKDTTLRAISYYDGAWSELISYYYLFSFYDDFGVDAFYPSGVYEGNVNVTLTPNNPEYIVEYHVGNGQWTQYTTILTLDKDTDIVARAVKVNSDGSRTEGDPYSFTYKIKPLPPEFAPESTQFTNANRITVYTPESTTSTTGRFKLYYTLDGTDPITSDSKILADEASDTAVINITKYTVVTAVVLKDDTSYSNVVKHSYDIVTLKPVKPLTTLLPGYYTHEIGGDKYTTQFMPVPQGTSIYYTISYDGGLCPDPIPNTAGTYLYDGSAQLDLKGNTVLKAVAVNAFGVKSDVGIFAYTITPEAPKAAPSATISGTKLPIVPVDAVKGSTVRYTIGGFTNTFDNTEGERFYINTESGMAYRDQACTQQLGYLNTGVNSGSVTLDISSEMDGIKSDTNRYVYATSSSAVLAPPYADKETGTYEEIKIDDDNHLLKVMLYSLNSGGKIQYRIDNKGPWIDYTDGSGLLLKPEDKKQDTLVLQLRYEKNGNYSSVVSYVYNFVPLAPIIELPSGTYLSSDKIYTKIAYDERIPKDKTYNIFYRRNGEAVDSRYNFSEIEPEDLGIDYTMTIKAYVLNEDTGRVSQNTIHYYIIENGDAASGTVYIAYPYDTSRIAAHLLGTGDYAEGIKLLSQNKTADIYYYYTYTKESDGQTITTNTTVYDVNRPIIPTELMDDITIIARLEDEDGKIDGSEKKFIIDFVHLEIPETSLETSGKVEFSKGTKYTLINDYPGDESIILYYTLDGSDPTDSSNANRLAYHGEELSLDAATTVKAVYFSSCGKCVECKVPNRVGCWHGVYGEVGTYKYTVPTTIRGGGGGGSVTVDKTRKYTMDIFGNEHPTHIGYINGYPDGSVRPEGDITREEITAILYRITNHQYEKPFVATGEVFPDIALGRWSTHDVEYMADKEVVYGYPDGEFKPSRNLTRAEFAALIFRFAGIQKAKIQNPFTDLTDGHWAFDEILALVNSGLMEGYPDQTYKPENNITRAEVMTVINKLLGRKPLESYVKSLEFNPFNDLFDNSWYYVAVLEATVTHNYWLDNKGYEFKWEDWK